MPKFNTIYLLHGKNGTPEGTVAALELAMKSIQKSPLKDIEFVRPMLAHTAAAVTAEESYLHAARTYAPFWRGDALLVGVSLGGLIAAKLQETERPDLHVIAISSPTGIDNLRLDKRMPNRLAFYSSKDEVINERISTWPLLAEAYDVPWLTHDTDSHRYSLAYFIDSYLQDGDLNSETKSLWELER